MVTNFHMPRPKPIVPRPLVFLLSASMLFLVLYTALVSLLHSPSMYRHITDPVLQEQNKAIIEYISGPLFGPNTLSFLTPEEASHMTDVKRVFDAVFIIAIICAGIMLGIITVFVSQGLWARLDELLSRSLRAAGWTILAIALFLVLASILNFDRLWLLFHAVLFPNGNWMFPATSTLITLYPSGFFERFVLRWLLTVTSFGLAAVVLSAFLDRMRRHDEFFEEKFESSRKTHKGTRHKR